MEMPGAAEAGARLVGLPQAQGPAAAVPEQGFHRIGTELISQRTLNQYQERQQAGRENQGLEQSAGRVAAVQ